MQTAGHGKHASSGDNGDREVHTVIDYKMVTTNVFLNIMQPICARIYENMPPVFLICVYIYIYISSSQLHTVFQAVTIIHVSPPKFVGIFILPHMCHMHRPAHSS